MKEDRIVPVVAGFSELNTNTRTGLYPVLFNAVLGMATGSNPPLMKAHELICDKLGDDDPQQIADALTKTRLDIAPTSSALRDDVLDAFCSAPDDLAEFLGEVSDASQIRNGLQYLNFAMVACAE